MIREHYNLTSEDGLIEMTVSVAAEPYQDLDNNVSCFDLENNEWIVVHGWRFEWDLIDQSAAKTTPAAVDHSDAYINLFSKLTRS